MDDDSQFTVAKVESFIEGFFWMLPNLGIALLVFVGFFFAAWAARASIARVFRRRRRENLGELLAGSARWGILFLGALVAATIVFPSISPANLLSTLGIGSIAIGFAFKDILQNWIAGLLILLRQPFRRGDQIKSGEFEGTVEHVEARATLIRTYDGQRVVIPNSDIYTRALIVRTAYPKRRTEYEVGIAYEDDIDAARQAILAALEQVEGIEKDPVPDVLPWSLESSQVNLKVRWWTASKRSTVVAVRARVIEAVKKALDAASIEIPYPKRVIFLQGAAASAQGENDGEGGPADVEIPEGRGTHVEIDDAPRGQAPRPRTERPRER